MNTEIGTVVAMALLDVGVKSGLVLVLAGGVWFVWALVAGSEKQRREAARAAEEDRS